MVPMATNYDVTNKIRILDGGTELASSLFV